jgi:hypothetical protein
LIQEKYQGEKACDKRQHNNNNASVQFNGYLLTCRLNSTSAYYKASTRTQIKHNSTNTQKQNTNRTKKLQKKEYKRSIGAKTLYPEKPQIS